MTLLEVTSNIEPLDEGSTIYASEPWLRDSQAVVEVEPDSGELPSEAHKLGLKYVLEVFIAKDFLIGWISNLDRDPTLEEKCDRLIRYAIDDA